MKGFRLSVDRLAAPAVITRRSFVVGAAAALAACQSERLPQGATTLASSSGFDPAAMSMYGPLPNEKFPIEAIDLSYVDPRFYRSQVPTPPAIKAKPGSIVVSPGTRYLYYVLDSGQSMRYGVGVGRDGFRWSGDAVIKRKESWPTWTPPPEMVKRDPLAAPFANGMLGGPDNPLGARALYLYQGENDTLYRIHGTTEPWTIGQAVSSGCIRLINHDIIDLHSRVAIGTGVHVLGDFA
ncbi:MAG: L,D-transpeptidase [Bauldia sp.]